MTKPTILIDPIHLHTLTPSSRMSKHIGDDITVAGVTFYRLTPHRYAKIRYAVTQFHDIYQRSIQHQLPIDHPDFIPEHRWNTLRTTFNQIHDWACQHYGELTLLQAYNQVLSNPENLVDL